MDPIAYAHDPTVVTIRAKRGPRGLPGAGVVHRMYIVADWAPGPSDAMLIVTTHVVPSVEMAKSVSLHWMLTVFAVLVADPFLRRNWRTTVVPRAWSPKSSAAAYSTPGVSSWLM